MNERTDKRMDKRATGRMTERRAAPARARESGPGGRRAAVLLALGMLGFVAAGLLAWRRIAADDAALLAGPALASASASAPPRAAAASTPSATPGGPRMGAPLPPDALPLQAQIDRLLATHDPEDAYRAYLLVSACATFNANGDRIIFDEAAPGHRQDNGLPGFRSMTDEEKRHDAKLCAGMTERERQNRLDYLAIAARAGVAGAAVEFANEGPFGDRTALATRPDDPLVKEWKDKARAMLSQAADSGTDLAALQFWANENLNGSALNAKDPVVAYRYLLATGLVFSDLLGADPMTRLYAADSGYMASLGADLTPQQRADALAAARAIAERARAARKAGRGG